MPQNEVITAINQREEKITIEASWESDVWRWGRIFRIILQHFEFADVTIDKILPKDADLLEAE